MSLVAYGSDSDSDGPSAPEFRPRPKIELSHNDQSSSALTQKTSSALIASETAESGPKTKKVLTGTVQPEAFDDYTFNNQYRTFQTLGYAQNPDFSTQNTIVGDVSAAEAHNHQTLATIRHSRTERRTLKPKRQKKGDSGVFEGEAAYRGPWAKYESSQSESDWSAEEPSEPSEVSGDSEPESAVTVVKAAPPAETTRFFGSEEFDYLGRTYMHVPQDLDVDLLRETPAEEWFLPKKQVHVWSGHAGGTTCLNYFPNSGHLLLSGGNDRKIQLWDCHHKREHLRGYFGHKVAIRDLCFNRDGTHFISSSFDKTIKQWDTETGKCIRGIKCKSVANCIRFNPKPAESNQFLAGMSDRTIQQFDIRSGEVVQTYDHHLSSVNSLVFVDNNERFMSTSDDRSIRVWEWKINVPIKFIDDVHQYSMPTGELHPSGKYVAFQSLASEIHVFSATDAGKFRENKKKLFKGHNATGQATKIGFSPNGKYIFSGDTTGSVTFWDWKNCKIAKKLPVDSKAITVVAAHPKESSKVAMAGLNGKIFYWD